MGDMGEKEDSRRHMEFLRSTGSPMIVIRRDRRERIREATYNLQAVFVGALLGPQSENLNGTVAVLARACSTSLRKMVLGERGGVRDARLPNDGLCRTADLSFDRVRKIIAPTSLNSSLGLDGDCFRAKKLNESTLQPEAIYTLPIEVQGLDLAIERPSPGIADSWTAKDEQAPRIGRCES